MKVIQINAVYGIGSTGIIVRDIEQMLIKNNIKTSVAYQSANIAPKNGYRVGNFIDWKLHALSTRILGKQGYASHVATKNLLKYLNKEKPDIVHLHNLHSNYVNIKMLLKYLGEKNISVVLTLHDCWFFTGKCFHFTVCKCERWKNNCGNCPQKNTDVKSMFFDQSKVVLSDKKYFFQHISDLNIVGCSDWITNLALKSPVFKNKNVTRIYNGIDTKIFYPRNKTYFRENKQLENKFVILGMANKWLQEKNKTMVGAIIECLSESDVIMIVGCTEQQKKQLANKKNILPIGFVSSRDHLANIYSAADVFINLTLEDTLPTVNMEAICCGTPVITYDSCGSPELIQEGSTGYVVEQNNLIAMQFAIKKVRQGLIDSKKCAELGSKMFDKNIQYKNYLKLYRNIYNERGNN